MTGIANQNPFAPPRANVEDPFHHEGGMVDATRGSRFAAVLIDGSPVAVIGILAAIALPAYAKYTRAVHAGASADAHAAAGPMLLLGGIGVLLMLAYCIYSIVLVYRYGQTFGKRVMKIRVVRTDGSRVTFARIVFLRWLVLAVAGMVPFVGGLVSLVDPLLIFRDSRQCLHDSVADTKVVTAESSPEATLAGSSGAHLRTISF